jgi:uncharacterized protein YlxW (UPF0749 family)
VSIYYFPSALVNKKLNSIRDQVKKVQKNFTVDLNSINEYQKKLNDFKTEINTISTLIPKV